MLQTNNTGVCSQCLSHAGPAPAHGAHHSGSRLHAPPRSKPLRLRHSGSPQRRRLAWACGLCPSRVRAAQAFGERGRCDSSPPPSLRLGFLGVPLAPLLRRMVTVQSPEKSQLAKKPACSLVDDVSLGLRLSPSSPSGSGCLPPEGDGLQPANFVPSFVLCTVLAVSCVRAFRVVAIPQSGLLAQVSSLWPRAGCSGPILKKALQPMPPAARFLKSTATCASCSSLPSPHLLVVDAGVCAAFPLGELLLGS